MAMRAYGHPGRPHSWVRRAMLARGEASALEVVPDLRWRLVAKEYMARSLGVDATIFAHPLSGTITHRACGGSAPSATTANNSPMVLVRLREMFVRQLRRRLFATEPTLRGLWWLWLRRWALLATQTPLWTSCLLRCCRPLPSSPTTNSSPCGLPVHFLMCMSTRLYSSPHFGHGIKLRRETGTPAHSF